MTAHAHAIIFSPTRGTRAIVPEERSPSPLHRPHSKVRVHETLNLRNVLVGDYNKTLC